MRVIEMLPKAKIAIGLLNIESEDDLVKYLTARYPNTEAATISYVANLTCSKNGKMYWNTSYGKQILRPDSLPIIKADSV